MKKPLDHRLRWIGNDIAANSAHEHLRDPPLAFDPLLDPIR
jgi:hypothetical protein